MIEVLFPLLYFNISKAVGGTIIMDSQGSGVKKLSFLTLFRGQKAILTAAITVQDIEIWSMLCGIL